MTPARAAAARSTRSATAARIRPKRSEIGRSRWQPTAISWPSSLKTLHRADFQQALAALPDRQRAVLRLHHVDGLRLAEIGRLYGVHESTVSRWVTRAAEEVADQTRRRLTASAA